jgi:hypothetical protein
VDETEARRILDESGAAIVAGVERCGPGWVEEQVGRVLNAWARLDAGERGRVEAQARAAGVAAATRVARSLRDLLATPVERQRSTPLELVRTLYREPTAVLAAAGVPPVMREEFDARTWPDDRYGLVPRTLADLGDPDLGPLHLAWGLAKAAALRATRG